MGAANPNIATSVRARLLNVAMAQGVDANQVLVHHDCGPAQRTPSSVDHPIMRLDCGRQPDSATDLGIRAMDREYVARYSRGD